MKRYTLSIMRKNADGEMVNVGKPDEFSSRVTLDAAFRAVGDLSEGYYLIGRDHKLDQQAGFRYHPTKRERWNSRIDYIQLTIKSSIETARAWTESITKQLDNPEADVARSMRWGMDAMKAAAVATVNRSALARIEEMEEKGTPIEQQQKKLLEYAMEKVFRGARFPSCSTSPMANTIEIETVSAWADLAERLGR
jgi:hypothetical protein